MKTTTPFSLLTGRVRAMRPWLATLTITLLAAVNAAASQAVIHFEVGDTKEDQLVTIDLFDGNAPQTVANFKSLVAKKFYKGLVVHRVVPETLVQMGDPLSRKNDRSRNGHRRPRLHAAGGDRQEARARRGGDGGAAPGA